MNPFIKYMRLYFSDEIPTQILVRRDYFQICINAPAGKNNLQRDWWNDHHGGQEWGLEDILLRVQSEQSCEISIELMKFQTIKISIFRNAFFTKFIKKYFTFDIIFKLSSSVQTSSR